MDSESLNSGKVTYRKSPIHGTGVFANELIRSGEVALKWADTREISSPECGLLPTSERAYIERQKDRILLMGIPERFVNHSCEPNTQPGHLCDLAVRDIAKGEEITTDLSGFFISMGSFPCNCGSAQCRGVIRGIALEQ